MKQYKILEKTIDIQFNDYGTLKKAFVHRSYINEHKTEKLENNERLEFLGDAVLELVATRHLFFNYPDQDEGKMTVFRSALVKGKHLAEVAKELNLGSYLFLSKGEENSGGREKNYILANELEALIGAIYIDQGYPVAEKFIQKFILTRLDDIINKGLHVDSKSLFQEICQEKEEVTPNYRTIKETGPDHNKKFIMGAYIGDLLIGKGAGSSKQKAEEEAAKKSLIEKGWL